MDELGRGYAASCRDSMQLSDESVATLPDRARFVLMFTSTACKGHTRSESTLKEVELSEIRQEVKLLYVKDVAPQARQKVGVRIGQTILGRVHCRQYKGL